MSGKLFDPGVVVWVLLEGYPWWPAQVVEEDDPEASPEVHDQKPKDKDTLVKFYQSDDFCWVKNGNHEEIRSFEENPRLSEREAMRDSNLRNAIRRAIKELENQGISISKDVKPSPPKSTPVKKPKKDTTAPSEKKKKKKTTETTSGESSIKEKRKRKETKESNDEQSKGKKSIEPEKKKQKKESKPSTTATHKGTEPSNSTSASPKKSNDRDEEMKKAPQKKRPIKSSSSSPSHEKTIEKKKTKKEESSSIKTEKMTSPTETTAPKKQVSSEKKASTYSSNSRILAVTDDELESIKTSLEKAIHQGNNSKILKLIIALENNTVIQPQQLKNVKIGLTVNSLRKSSDETIANLSKILVSKWKKLVEGDTKDVEKTKSQAKSSSSSSTKSLSLDTKSLSLDTKKSNSSTDSNKEEKKKANESTPTDSTRDLKKTEVNNNGNVKSETNGQTRKTPTTPSKTVSSPISDEISDILSGMLTAHKETARNKAIEKFAHGLSNVPKAKLEQCCDIAIRIESELFTYYCSKDMKVNNQYLQQMGNIKFNLEDPKNPDLRENVYDGEITAGYLVRMSSKDMASKEKILERRRITKEQIESRTAPKPSTVTTRMFQCGKCKSNMCTYYQMQTRSADEPMTIFITCSKCGNRWKQ